MVTATFHELILYLFQIIIDLKMSLKISSQNLAQTIVMITHNEEIAQMADRIIRIEDGKIVKGGE